MNLDREHVRSAREFGIAEAKREALIAINTRIVVGDTKLSIAIDKVGTADPATRRSVEGRYPKHLNARKLLWTNGIRLEWDARRRMLSFY